MNPILPLQHFVPDGEARQMPDGRLYLYGSYDISGDSTWGSHVLHVFSTDDLIHWKDHGICLSSRDIIWANEDVLLYAPDCIYKNGKYYLYFCMADSTEGVAISDTPYGPFENPIPISCANGDSIDPAILIDDDGRAYYYWGQFSLRGVCLMDDMQTPDMDTFHSNIIDEKQHGFHEGISIRKRAGIYYLVYTDITRGKASCLSYATSDSPFGPFQKGGVIIDNMNCDPQTWNNHGCIAEFNGQWYVFYHRSSQNSRLNRRMCIEPIFFHEDGRIEEVVMTTQGSQLPLSGLEKISAGRACTVKNGVYIAPAPVQNCELLTHAVNGSWAAYRYIDFTSPSRFTITASSACHKCTLEVWADGQILGACKIDPTGSWNFWKTFTCEILPVNGTHTLYLVFVGADPLGRLADIKDFIFS